jgi:hypothetical protein
VRAFLFDDPFFGTRMALPRVGLDFDANSARQSALSAAGHTVTFTV